MIFSEIYGTYYRTVARILDKALEGPLTADGLYDCIIKNAYSESVVPVTDSIYKEKWQLLKFDRERNLYTSVIRHSPKLPLTVLQLQYLKAVIEDKRIRLFDLDFSYLEEQLSCVEPLWREEDYRVFDRYGDGDDFEDEDYIRRFRLILKAKQDGMPLYFVLSNRSGRELKVKGIPEKLEYSEKDDKFRVILSGRTRTNTINLGRLIDVIPFDDTVKRNIARRPEADTDTIVLELIDERNALERVSLHFANLRKKIIKIDENKYRIELEFNREDETEMVIRLLQFGPVIKVIQPDYIKGEIIRRLNLQLKLIR